MEWPNVNWTQKIWLHSTIEPSSEQFGNTFIVHVLLSVLHCSKLFCFGFCFWSSTLPRSPRGEGYFPSASCACVGFFFFFFFSANFVHLCLSHTGQLSSLYRACVISAHVQVTIVTDNALVTHLIKMNPWKKKNTALCSLYCGFQCELPFFLCESKGLFSIKL